MTVASANMLEVPQAVLGVLAVCSGTCLFADIVGMPSFIYCLLTPLEPKISMNYRNIVKYLFC